jgi:hypothetical protein
MSREEPKITITQEAALQLVDRDDCKHYLSAVNEAIARAKKIIERREVEVSRMNLIATNLKQRLEFLSISEKVQPGTWYEERSSRTQKSYTYILSVNDTYHTLSGWKFTLDSPTIASPWRGEHIFLNPCSGELIASPPKENDNNITISEKRYGVNFTEANLKGDRSFLMGWIPSSALSVAMIDPDILEIKSILEDMHKEDSPTFRRRLQRDDNRTNGNKGKGNVEVVKHQGSWWLLLSLE